MNAAGQIIEMDVRENPLTSEQARDLDEAEQRIASATFAYFYDIGRELTHIRADRLYLRYAESFEDYCLHRLNIVARHARRLCDEYAMAQALMDKGIDRGLVPASEFVARALVPVWREKPEA